VLKTLKKLDWYLFLSIVIIFSFGLVTMNSFTGDYHYFSRQLIWGSVAILIMVSASFVDFRFLRRTPVVVSIFLIAIFGLMLTFGLGHIAKGAKSWISTGFFSIQPTDPAKIALIIILAKYFSRRHVEIAHIRHILVSGFYAFFIFFLVTLQPDFGSAVTIFFIWLGMVLVSGISKKHLFVVFSVVTISFTLLWNYGFQQYQKDRIKNFLHPLADIRGSGYNANQAMITVGSGQVLGKGIGYGTQSRLNFLPEYQTDFIFAAFAEEWGFVGVIILFVLFGVIFWRIFHYAIRGETNFEILYASGLAIFLMTHLVINIGMNIGIMPVTGIPVPFMSYGGSHLVTELLAVGILMGMKNYSRAAHKEAIKDEYLIAH
jgi:rod shape determining protein RodA